MTPPAPGTAPAAPGVLPAAPGAAPALAAAPAAPTASDAVVRALRPLVSAEATAEALAAAIDPADLEQAVWLRLLERVATQGPPSDTARWVRGAVRGEARRARRRSRREGPYTEEITADPADCPERIAVGAAERRALRAAVGRLPDRCARLISALLAPGDPTYREIAGKLGMSQGSLGPIRSRCLGCLRRMLTAEVVAPEPRGKER
ncbi:RNA polymerase sigma factor [Streptomyces sp. DT171]|uniref:RNA polymerase sigma factor n=1 Tax=Streptomyces sp. DT171 TaxID=3416524 RepID=UPI003CEB9F82